MNIYSTVDFKNIDKIIALFNSVLINSSKNDLKFYILTDKIEELPFIPDKIKEILTIKEAEFDKKWSKLLFNFNDKFYKGSSWCKHDMNFARFLFFKSFPEVDRVIYLDWDMVVLKDIFNLESYYNDKKNMIVATTGLDTIRTNIFTDDFRAKISPYNAVRKINAVIDIPKYKLISDNLNINIKDIIKINGFNAGFYIVSNYHFEEKKLIDLINRLTKIQEKFNCFNFGTQVVMNLMNLKNRVFVEKDWNNLPNKKNMNEINIVHYNGLEKPWKEPSELNKVWFDYYKMVYPDWTYSVEKPVINTTNIKKKVKKNLKKSNKSNNNLLKFLI